MGDIKDKSTELFNAATSLNEKEQVLLSALWEIEDYCNYYLAFASVDACMPLEWAIEIRGISSGAFKKITLDTDHMKEFRPTKWLEDYLHT